MTTIDGDKAACGCAYELVEDGAVQRVRWFHEPQCHELGEGGCFWPLCSEQPDGCCGALTFNAKLSERRIAAVHGFDARTDSFCPDPSEGCPDE